MSKEDSVADNNNDTGDALTSLDDAFDQALEGIEGDGADGDKPDADGKGSEQEPEADVGGDTPPDEGASGEGEGDDLEPEPETDDEPEGDDDAQLEAPGHWPKDLREQFGELAPEAQAILVERDKAFEAQATRKSQELSDQARFAEDIRGLFSDRHREAMALAGLDEIAAFRRILAVNDMLERNPEEFIQHIAQQHNVDLGLLVGSDVSGEGDEVVDPMVKQLRSEIAELKEALSQTQGTLANQGIQGIQNMVTEFASGKDSEGNLLRPHFEAVSKTMGGLMEGVPELKQMPDGHEKMQKAYEMAVKLDGSLETPKAPTNGDAEKKAAADKARKAKGAPKRPKSASKDQLDAPKDLDALIDWVADNVEAN